MIWQIRVRICPLLLLGQPLGICHGQPLTIAGSLLSVTAELGQAPLAAGSPCSRFSPWEKDLCGIMQERVKESCSHWEQEPESAEEEGRVEALPDLSLANPLL